MNYFTETATLILKCTFIAYHCVPSLRSPASLGILRWGNASDQKLEVVNYVPRVLLHFNHWLQIRQLHSLANQYEVSQIQAQCYSLFGHIALMSDETNAKILTDSRTGGDNWDALVLRGWRLSSKTWNQITSPWMKQLTWLIIVHSGDWCLRLALHTPSVVVHVKMNEWVREWVSDWVSEWLSEWMNEWVNERVSEWTSD